MFLESVPLEQQTVFACTAASHFYVAQIAEKEHVAYTCS